MPDKNKILDPTLPFVSCYCSTFARVEVLEEAIESFLRQDYKGRKELVILNDMPDQKLFYDHPEVRIHNLTERVIPLGRKFNQCVKLCQGDVFCVWDDDDIYLPWKLSLSIEKIRDGIFHTIQGFFEPGKMHPLNVGNNIFHCNLAYERRYFYDSGGYTEEDLRGTDIRFMKRIGVVSQTIDETEIFYIYRWAGTNSYHVSQWDRTSGNISDFTDEYIRKRIQKGTFRKGDIRLKPHWSRDWELLAKAALIKSAVVKDGDDYENEQLQRSTGVRLISETMELEIITDSVKQLFKCNQSTALIFQAINGHRTNGEIERLIRDIYPGQDVKTDVQATLQQLKQMNVVSVVSSK